MYGILNIGKGALATQQRAIGVTGHNIANANTEGYSRQKVIMETNPSICSQEGQEGRGVRAKEILRVYDRFLGIQINNENKELGKWEAQKGALENVEIIFNEPSKYRLQEAMNEFWASWQEVANNASGYSERTVLLAKAQRLAQNFRAVFGDLEEIQDDMEQSMQGCVEEISGIAAQIADLNDAIARNEVNGRADNDQRDRRDLLMQELSYMIGFTSFEDSDGRMNISIGQGRPLVTGNASWELSVKEDVSDTQKVLWYGSDGTGVDITSDISSGKLEGLIEVRDRRIPEYLNRLDTLATTIMEDVNALHETGYGLEGATGNAFFTGDSASNVEVSPQIVAEVNKIGASGTLEGLPGDNTIALAIADLQHELTMSDDTSTYDGYYGSLVSDLGIALRNAITNSEHESEMINHLNNSRESISGVSLDEEMVNLIKFQHAYEAAAKLIGTVDELTETLLSIT